MLNNLAELSYAERLIDICLFSLGLLKTDCARIDLISLVVGKQYHAYRKAVVTAKGPEVLTSRPVNSTLFITDETILTPLLERFRTADYEGLSPETITALLYTIAMAFCAANDVRQKDDKKTPGTFFEWFIAHIFARQFSKLPAKKVRVPAGESGKCELKTDIIFDLGPGQVKFHVPVKLSTRERSIQAWAHQRILAGLWGDTEFKGLLVVLGETKLAHESLKVTEILVPQQWAVFQRYIARMDKVYFLDLPEKYFVLATGHPKIDVKPLGAFFAEKDALLVR